MNRVIIIILSHSKHISNLILTMTMFTYAVDISTIKLATFFFIIFSTIFPLMWMQKMKRSVVSCMCLKWENENRKKKVVKKKNVVISYTSLSKR